MDILAYSGFINSFLVLAIGVFVYLKSKRELKNKLFFLLCFSVFIWQASYGFWQMAKSEEESLFFLRFITISSVFSSVLFLHLVLSILSIVKEKKPLLQWAYIITFVIISLVFTPFYISGLREYPFYQYWPVAGFSTHVNIIWGLVLSVSAFNLLIKRYKESKGESKNQIAYFLLALFVLFIGGLFNVPQWYGVPLFPYGNFLIFLYPLIIAFAIIRYHLFEIRVILTEILVLIMGFVLLILPFIMTTSFLRNLTITIFISFVFLGYLLIRSTHQEVQKRKEAEELANKLQKASSELRKAYIELKKASENIKELSEMKTEFLKVVNHQLRTPVSIIKGMSSMLVEGTLTKKKQKEYVKKLYLSSERLHTILDDILVAQNLAGGPTSVELRPCKIEEVIERLVNHQKSIAEVKGLKISFSKPKENIPIALLDEEIINRIISRLIDNAILYTDKGKIEISLELKEEKTKKFIQISVKDSGIGLDKKDKKNLFRLFHRGEKATSLHPNGSGLGLFIVKNLIESHKGTVKAESKGRDKGSTFVISLPFLTEV
ncbi:MAG: ATP-binding protein [Candidatus Nealsonbacteria bacterium]